MAGYPLQPVQCSLAARQPRGRHKYGNSHGNYRKLAECALPDDFGYEWTSMAFQEQNASGQADLMAFRPSCLSTLSRSSP